MDTVDTTAVRIERTLPASPHRVYRAWLDPQTLTRWMAPSAGIVTRAEVDERPGGRYVILHEFDGRPSGRFECELLELEPDRRIVLRWGFLGPADTADQVFDTLLTVTLAEAPGGTALTLVHERLDDYLAAMPEAAANVPRGWERALGTLAGLLAD